MALAQVRNNYMVYDDYVRLFQMRRLLCVQFAHFALDVVVSHSNRLFLVLVVEMS